MRLLSDYHESSWTWSLMHSHDSSETDESLARIQSVVIGLAVNEALFHNNTTKVVSQKHSQDNKKKSPQVSFVLITKLGLQELATG